jgi:protein-tyrosine phosphatase
MTTMTINRNLDFEVTYNVRHLGGYRTRDGSETRPEIIRAASLHRLTDAGVESFVAHGITTVVDLRSEKEREEFATPNMSAHGVRHLFAPVVHGDASPGSFAEGFAGFAPIYQGFLEHGGEAFRTLFGAIAASHGGVVFHCAAGKDRTGVAAALLLELAGVADDDITSDYARSEALLREGIAKVQPQPPAAPPSRFAALDDETRAKLLGSPPAYIVQTLAYIRGRWGSARGYMHAIGLSRDEIMALRARLTW